MATRWDTALAVIVVILGMDVTAPAWSVESAPAPTEHRSDFISGEEAEDLPDEVTGNVNEVPEPAAILPPAAQGQKKRKGRPRRERREAEGTKAKGRVEVETVIKSRYRHNGRPLDVDPD